ncbi:class I SAM-dependent methyltransferase [Knoellia sp. 3-2P3]|uniref:class I SAM-dependent methyltransferase n=1 Tax=unclassified Knoellia TaxID=2618719 RepID=UPI0023DCE857|nr:class I SAM-dependent methyltransferase [Knoellia sp. 3-2P3]MDF2091118.1 class I SAM-dependent methyltransferase [Knoellia sp. 3-2P3]
MVRPPDFEALYAADPDPWHVRDSWYERRKEAVVLALLARERYDHAWDAACGTGALALALARRCGHVTASDASPTAVALTEGLLQACPNATSQVSALPAVPPLTTLPDLVVLAEVLYYLPAQARSQALEGVAAAARAEAEVGVVHWRHHPDDAHLPGADATEEADTLLQQAGWRRHSWHDDPDFVAASWVRP